MFKATETELGPSSTRIFLVMVGVALFAAAVLGGWMGWCAWMGFVAVLGVLQLIRDRARTKLVRALAS